MGICVVPVSYTHLAQIISVSAPVLGILYPMAIVLIALSFFHRWLAGKRWVYPLGVLFAGVFSVLDALKGLIHGLSDVLKAMPLASVSLGWVLPAAVGIVLGLILPSKQK